jgi:hypothetical protein
MAIAATTAQSDTARGSNPLAAVARLVAMLAILFNLLAADYGPMRGGGDGPTALALAELADSDNYCGHGSAPAQDQPSTPCCPYCYLVCGHTATPAIVAADAPHDVRPTWTALRITGETAITVTTGADTLLPDSTGPPRRA